MGTHVHESLMQSLCTGDARLAALVQSRLSYSPLNNLINGSTGIIDRSSNYPVSSSATSVRTNGGGA